LASCSRLAWPPHHMSCKAITRIVLGVVLGCAVVLLCCTSVRGCCSLAHAWPARHTTCPASHHVGNICYDDVKVRLCALLCCTSVTMLLALGQPTTPHVLQQR
jgi:hypothetical protein